MTLAVFNIEKVVENGEEVTPDVSDAVYHEDAVRSVPLNRRWCTMLMQCVQQPPAAVQVSYQTAVDERRGFNFGRRLAERICNPTGSRSVHSCFQLALVLYVIYSPIRYIIYIVLHFLDARRNAMIGGLGNPTLDKGNGLPGFVWFLRLASPH